MINFQEPIWLLLLLPLPAVLLVYFSYLRGRGGIPFTFRFWNAWGFYPSQSLIGFWVIISRFLSTSALVLLLASLARPSFSVQKKIDLSVGSAIILLLDLSPSMAAVDSPPYTRLEQAIQAIKTFIAERPPNDSIGIVGFGSKAALLWPPTQNHQSLAARLDELKPMLLGDGTAMGLGIAMAASHLEPLASPKKIILMFTDGSSNTGEIPPEGAAKVVEELGISFYSAALGAKNTPSAKVVDPATGKAFEGKLGESYNPERLRRIAQIAGGYFFYGNSNKILREKLSLVHKQEEVQQNLGIRVQKKGLEGGLLQTGFFLLLAAFILRFLLLKEIV